MANQNDLSQMLQEITRLIRSGQFPDIKNIDPGFNINANKGPAPVDPRQMADFLARFGQPPAQQKPISSEYDPKKPGSSWLGINNDYMNQFGEKPSTGGAMTKPGLQQDGIMFIRKPENPVGTTKPGLPQDGANLRGQPTNFQPYTGTATVPPAAQEAWVNSLYSRPSGPVIPRAPKGETVRLSPGLYRDDKGNIVNSGAKKPAVQGKRK